MQNLCFVMKTKTFAAWVEPYARQLSENRAEVVAFARSVPAEAWERPSPLDGWSYKDILAHIGKGNDQLFQKLLRQVIAVGSEIRVLALLDVVADEVSHLVSAVIHRVALRGRNGAI